MIGMRAASLLLPFVLLAGARAQDLLSETSCSQLSTSFPNLGRKSPLKFFVRTTRPWLNYAFRFQAGYSIDIPLRQFVGTGNSIRVVAQVAPADGSGPPVCFVQSAELPEVPAGIKSEFHFAGGFFLGEGSYRIDLTVGDQRGRLSRQHLNITAVRKGRQREVPLRLEHGSIQAIYRLGWQPRPSPDGRAPRRLTVFFHAASLYGPRSVFGFYDQGQLLSSLSSVLSEGAFDEVRLIAFNLDQQRELFRRDRFGVGDFHRLAETLPSVNRATIPVAALEQGPQHLGWLESLLRDGLSAEPRPAAILFLGPEARDGTRWKSLPCDSDRTGPRLFYFQLRIDVNICRECVQRELPDTVERLVQGCSGEVYRIHNPAELAAAIQKLRDEVQ